jgi:hypothetical protein
MKDIRLQLKDTKQMLSKEKSKNFTLGLQNMSANNARKASDRKFVPDGIKKAAIKWDEGSAMTPFYDLFDQKSRNEKQMDANMFLGFLNKISIQNIARANELMSHIIENNDQLGNLRISKHDQVAFVLHIMSVSRPSLAPSSYAWEVHHAHPAAPRPMTTTTTPTAHYNACPLHPMRHRILKISSSCLTESVRQLVR